MTSIAKSIGRGMIVAAEGVQLAIGAALVSAGAWMIYRPAGFIVAGALLIAGAIFRGMGDGAN